MIAAARLRAGWRHVASRAEEAGFGWKEPAWNDRALLLLWRERWAELANAHLAGAGLDLRIDHRSNAARGLGLEPQNKIGPAGARRAVRGEDAERAEEHRALARRNGERLLADPGLALGALTEQQSTFTRADLARLVHRQSDGAAQFTAIMAKVEASPERVAVGKDGRGRERFSTREMVAIERRMQATAVALARRGTHRVNDRRRNAVVGGKRLSEEQHAAYWHVTRRQNLSALTGIAGGGKSTLLGTAQQVWQTEGYRVRGATLSGIAAEALSGSSGIESRTIASWEYAWAQGQERLTAKDVLVVDEAGMIGSRQMQRLLAAVQAAGAKAVLVGDVEQLQAIEAGAAFRAIVERVGAIAISEPRRQQVAWQRTATKHLATARTGEALGSYESHGMVHAHQTREAARAAVIAGWNAARRAEPGRSQLILAHERADVRVLNEAARAVRRAGEELGEDRILATELGTRTFAEGDRIYFLRNERGLGVRNGTLGTIERIEGEGEAAQLRICLDGPDGTGTGRMVVFGLGEYAHLDHGYAATIHKNQGATVDLAHVLATPGMDRHLTYVALSRHRQAAHLYWSGEDFGSRAQLAERLGRERAKDTTLDYGESEAELCAAYAERRGLNPLAPVSEIIVGPARPQPAGIPEAEVRTAEPGAPRRRLRRVRLGRALRFLVSVLQKAVEQQKAVAAGLMRLGEASAPATEPPAPDGHGEAAIRSLEDVPPPRPRGQIVPDAPAPTSPALLVPSQLSAPGPFEGLRLNAVPLATPAPSPAPTPLVAAVVRYLEVGREMTRMRQAGLPVLPHQAAAGQAARQAVEALRPGFAADLIAVLQRQPTFGRAEAGLDGVAALVAAAEQMRAERRVLEEQKELEARARQAVTDWKALDSRYDSAVRNWRPAEARAARAEMEAFAERLKQDRQLEEFLRQHKQEFGIIPGTRLHYELWQAAEHQAQELAPRPRGPGMGM